MTTFANHLDLLCFLMNSLECKSDSNGFFQPQLVVYDISIASACAVYYSEAEVLSPCIVLQLLETGAANIVQ